MIRLTVKNFFFVMKCPVCREPLKLGSEENGCFCEKCEKKWMTEKSKLCAQCGMPAAECLCMPELLLKSGADALLKLCFYEAGSGAVADRLVLYLKDYRDKQAFDTVVREMSAHIGEYLRKNTDASDDILFTYVPRSREAVLQKGFDQAELLAKGCAKSLDCDFHATIYRKRAGKQQKSLSQSERLKNAKASLVLLKKIDIKGRTIFLLDDVVTTGAGMSVGARLLLSRGAKRVICASLAQTEENNGKA